MANKARTTINIPSDIDKEISRIRRNMPHLTRNEVLFMLARRGVAESFVDDITKLRDALTAAVGSQTGTPTTPIHADTTKDVVGETRRNKELTLQVLILLRRFVKEAIPEKGTQLLEQAKADFETIRRRPSE
ncbi:MAG: hypothetical protein HPY59_07460 [Anaerolineae bacterium]|nr:hypothetical protein [Anaerolineae bacterium]